MIYASLLITLLVAALASEPSTMTTPDTVSLGTSSPAPNPEVAEARVALRQHREATALNRFTFEGNVLKGTGDVVDHWIVMFCPGWNDQCQSLLPSYELLGVQWENKLNKAVMSSAVRFAKVDCATEKALCNSQGVEDYPSVFHYRNQQLVGSWSSGAPGLVRFVKQALEGVKPRAKRRAVLKQKTRCTMETSGQTCPAAALAQDLEQSPPSTPLRWLASASALLSFLIAAFTLVRRSMQALHTTKPQPASRPPLRASGIQAYLPPDWVRERASIEL